MTRIFNPTGNIVGSGFITTMIVIGSKVYYVTWGYDADGNLTASVKDKNGNTTTESKQVEKGLRSSLGRLAAEGYFKGNTWLDDLMFIATFTASFNDFASKHFNDFVTITGNDSRYKGNALETFSKHAMIGFVIGDLMTKYDDPASIESGNSEWKTDYKDFNRLDMEIGFWVSFFSDCSGIEMGIIHSEAHTISMVDLANIVKAMAMQETHVGNMGRGTDGNADCGIMKSDIYPIDLKRRNGIGQ